MNDVTKLADLIDAQLSRRAALLGIAGGAALAATTGIVGDANAAGEQADDSPSTLTFSDIRRSMPALSHLPCCATTSSMTKRVSSGITGVFSAMARMSEFRELLNGKLEDARAALESVLEKPPRGASSGSSLTSDQSASLRRVPSRSWRLLRSLSSSV